MNKLFKVLLNVLSFGIPLILQSLLKLKTFKKILNREATVVLFTSDNTDSHIRIEIKDFVITLKVDEQVNILD